MLSSAPSPPSAPRGSGPPWRPPCHRKSTGTSCSPPSVRGAYRRFHPNDEQETAKSTTAGNNPVIAHLDHIRSYYDALNSGDPDLVASHFTEDAVHYYTRLGPHEGAERIGQNAKLGVGAIDGQWFIEHGIESGDEAVIEWTMTWRDPKSGEERLDRGTEWFQMRDGKIAEVRAYHHGGKKNPQGDLLGFDHKDRGYTMLDDWQPPPETAKRKAAEEAPK